MRFRYWLVLGVVPHAYLFAVVALHGDGYRTNISSSHSFSLSELVELAVFHFLLIAKLVTETIIAIMRRQLP